MHSPERSLDSGDSPARSRRRAEAARTVALDEKTQWPLRLGLCAVCDSSLPKVAIELPASRRLGPERGAARSFAEGPQSFAAGHWSGDRRGMVGHEGEGEERRVWERERERERVIWDRVRESDLRQWEREREFCAKCRKSRVVFWFWWLQNGKKKNVSVWLWNLNWTLNKLKL